MVEKQKITVLKNVLGSYRRNGHEFLFFCPLCKHHKRKLSLNLEKNVWKCWVCDSAGKKIFQLIKKFGGYSDVRSWIKCDKTIENNISDDELSNLFREEEKRPIKLALPAEYIPLSSRKLPKSAVAPMSYLKNRDITKSDILYWKIGYCPSGEYQGRIIIPSFDEDGDISFFVARSYENHYLKYKNPKVPKNEIVFNDLFIDFSSPVFITEGVFDAIRLGKNAIPVLGSTLHKNSALFKKIVLNKTSTYLALDADASKKENKIIKNLLHFGVEVCKIDTVGFKDIADMPIDVLEERKKRAITISTDSFLMRELLQAI
tara:strand:- start:121 stop:1071 length:951 start_codon:yes stop_codon:yes gene_type:complete